ncbi:hypothetical protein LK540_13390 [Massilia sp. IC2-278]|uniref:hypothetical protein n=1 Tax=Massilia sp. IC2-278 TaxID=2887200 RepID=UPI001E30D838|nr:hypothetical protein [Massilia sp. IC2-278]MCC2961417.1 hypothetical protein [Massilia sp. IC2-278]
MEIQDIRRARLAQLIDERYEGSQARYIDETGENQGEISALLRTKKSFGERKARKLEAKSNLPIGWLDTPIDRPAPTKVGEPEKLEQGARLRIVETVEPQWMALVYVSQRELELLTHYRQAGDTGKGLVELAAASAADNELGTGSAHQS